MATSPAAPSPVGPPMPGVLPDGLHTMPHADAPESPSAIGSIVDALRGVVPLQGLTDAEYEWLARNGRERVAEAGMLVFSEAEPACSMVIVLRGEIHVRRRKAGPMALFIGRAGLLSGKLPFSRMKNYGGDGYTTAPTWVLDIHESTFPAMLAAIPTMAQRCVSVLLDRVREVTRMEQQAEKLAALGKLAANLAHELNNPASAAQRTAASLATELRDYGDRKYALGSLCLDRGTSDKLHAWIVKTRAEMAENRRLQALEQAEPSTEPAPIAEIDRETKILKWLEQHSVPDAWSVAPALAETQFPLSYLDCLAEQFPDEVISPLAATFASSLRVERMAETIISSTVRIFDLISAIKDYSYMDQAPIQHVDLAQSLENTLSMFASRLGDIRVETDFDPELSTISAYGSELNQVWTALIENALDAMGQGGVLHISTRLSGEMALVSISDDGPGVDPELKSRIFEPFFTTKAPGKGLGLGLDTAQRIVNKHSGFLQLESRPGSTCFQVRLPLGQAQAY